MRRVDIIERSKGRELRSYYHNEVRTVARLERPLANLFKFRHSVMGVVREALDE